MLALAVIAAGQIRRAHLPGWIVLMWPLLLLALVMSYRRSFWLVAILAIGLIAVLGATKLQRRLAVPVGIVVIGSILAALSSGFAAGVQGPVVERAQSLAPSQIAASASDRYRITERRNVVDDLQRHPAVGLGIGVPWTPRAPVIIESADARQYVHVALLWYWMKLGALGPIAYVLVMLGTAATALRVFRLHPDPWVCVIGLGSAAGVLGLMAGELTATFTGADARFTVMLGAQIGALAVLHRQALAARANVPSRSETPPSEVHHGARETWFTR